MSKSYGIPGLRSGWLTCRDPNLMETFLAAKEQMFITGGILDEELTARVLEHGGATFAQVKVQTETQLAIVREWAAGNEYFEWVEPAAGVVSFPRLRPELSIDVDSFHRTLFEEHGTYVGPGWWFDQDPRYFRLGFAWPTPERRCAVGLRGSTKRPRLVSSSGRRARARPVASCRTRCSRCC